MQVTKTQFFCNFLKFFLKYLSPPQLSPSASLSPRGRRPHLLHLVLPLWRSSRQNGFLVRQRRRLCVDLPRPAGWKTFKDCWGSMLLLLSRIIMHPAFFQKVQTMFSSLLMNLMDNFLTLDYN